MDTVERCLGLAGAVGARRPERDDSKWHSDCRPASLASKVRQCSVGPQIAARILVADSKKVFISYSSKDKAFAQLIKNELTTTTGVEVWLDTDKIRPGDRVSSVIQEGLTASDYFVVLISNNSNQSIWVKQEISLAFQLAGSKKLSVVPVLLPGADVPFEFTGLLYIDARTSASDGIIRLRDFFKAQNSSVSSLEKRSLVRKSADDKTMMWKNCQQ